MKLYTEEDLLNSIAFACYYKKSVPSDDTINNFIESLTPIELPSDEEIEEELKSHEHMTLELEAGFRAGVCYVKNKIQGCNK